MMLLREMNSPSDSIEGVNQLIEEENNRDRSIAEALKKEHPDIILIPRII